MCHSLFRGIHKALGLIQQIDLPILGNNLIDLTAWNAFYVKIAYFPSVSKVGTVSNSSILCKIGQSSTSTPATRKLYRRINCFKRSTCSFPPSLHLISL